MPRLLKNTILIYFLLLMPVAMFSQLEAERLGDLNRKAAELYEKGMYKEAGALYEQASDIIAKDKSIGDDVHNTLNGLAKIYWKKGDYKMSETFFMSALSQRKLQYGDFSREYAETANDLSKLFLDQSKYADAEILLNKALDIRKKLLGTKDPDYAETLNYLGFLYMLQNKIGEAKDALDAANNILSAPAYKNTSQYIKSLYSTASLNYYIGKFDVAEKYLTETMQLSKAKYGEKNPEYSTSLSALASVYASMGRYKESIDKSIEALAIQKEYYGENTPMYAGVLRDLGTVYMMIGNKDAAIPILQRTMELTEKMLGKEHNYYYTALNSLAIIYDNANEPSKAEPLMLESLEIRRKMYKNKGPYVISALNTLAAFYIKVSNYAIAEKYLLEALELIDENPEFGTVASSIYAQLGLVEMEWGFRDRALVYYKKAMDLQGKYYGEDHHNYLSILNSYAYALASIFEPETDAVAEKILLEVLDKRRKTSDVNKQDYFISLNNLASFYDLRKQREKSQLIYDEAIKVDASVLDNNNSFYISFYSNIGNNCENLGDYVRAEEYYTRSFDAMRNQMRQHFAYFSEKERELYLNSKSIIIESYKAFANKYIKENPSLSGLAYNVELFSKSLLLNSFNNVLYSITNSGNEELIKLWEKLTPLKGSLMTLDDMISRIDKQIAIELGITPTQSNILYMQKTIMEGDNEELKADYKDVAKLKMDHLKMENEIQSYEKFIIDQAKEFQVELKDFSIEWHNVKDILKKNEAAIEFITFREMDIDSLSFRLPSYCALIVRPDSQYPELVYLCNEPELQEAIKLSKYDSREVYPLIWKPLEKYLAGVDEVYLATSGLLHSISFAGMRTEGGYLYDDYNIHSLLSTKDIIALKERGTEQLKDRTAMLVGGADYEMSGDELARIDSELEQTFHFNMTRGLLDDFDPTRGQGFSYLPGSGKEVKIINDKLSGLDWKTTLLFDKTATEARFKSVLSASAPGLLHISTHGFYFPQEQNEATNVAGKGEVLNTYRYSNNPLMRSGLAFTGANYVWNGGEPVEDADDGILTAYEVSNLNLSDTKLVVLSACDTGLGDAVGSEGVYGLQRAFRLAGAQSLLVSLWKVPDAETVELMDQFYSNWIGGTTIKQSLQDAQNKMRNKYPDNPGKWAGFVLIE